MALTLLVGGARSGKSSLAVRLAGSSGRPVHVVATAEARDEEMAHRIALHQAERPSTWVTVEELIGLADVLERTPPEGCVIVDCLSLWVANLQGAGWEATRVEHEAERAAERAARRSGPTIAVTNEVGLGIVPARALARSYRDLLGRVNAIWSREAHRAYFVAAGRVLALDTPDGVAVW